MNLKQWNLSERLEVFRSFLQQHRKYPLITGTVVAVFLSLFIYKIFFFPKEKPHMQPIASVQVVDSTAQKIAPTLVLTAQTKAQKIVTLRAELSGKVTEVLEDKGVSVQSQQPLFKLVDKDRAAALAQAQARLDHREAEYNSAKKLKTKDFIAENNFLNAKANLELAKADLAKINYEFDQLTVKAPLCGYYENRFVEAGDYVNPGDRLATIVDLSSLKLISYVSEKEVANIKLNQIAKVTLTPYQQPFEAKVVYCSRVANSKTRTFVVEMVMDNHKTNFPDGLTVKVEIQKEEVKAHALKPSLLTLNEQGIVGVMTVDSGNKAVFLPVEIVQAHENSIFVCGLPDTVKLVTVGADFVKSGQLVTAIPEKKNDSL